ncbi:Hydroxyacylglutathione hydrolase [Prochlorococcus marinus str. MIT 9312]|uniref:Hydroxyacylglutathione hydrolase n=1 Tax=Prochlorococcus marinus (strain MIT 9312) TaxID=74546 RepID=GLO2_PROM9|nr:hydroxyacylglutathione hydrolase [Prochlorococcus marinus]Q31BX5.1 RecName: Full=Hydroxyacylglutathione hydrolase; AltName: Full=Glyoxalase II; Short=Glx II [Prochlorococcus marinus str. MIT 9312]ABB49620.1 Hydroxyacylglutathione hydrolase [Prochlorococcus marinus str. MIT 9312]KGG02089.1 Hydroxyacylglutathione hydrolase [Prochlorococcus marinus str. MIT 9311]
MEFNKAQNIIGLRVLNDNVIWLWEKDKSVVVIDPAIHEPVIRYIDENNLYIKAILQTHHHSDHIGGTKYLIERWPNVQVIASSKDKKRIPFQNISVEDGETLNILGEEIKIIEVLGHTNSHIAFFVNGESPVLFIGDTLFSGGCGRIFEGTYQQMYSSLERIKSLPKNTLIYCAHEYTKANLLWALNLKPKDQDIKNKLLQVEKKLSINELTIPFLLDEEMKINLFLRAKNLKEFTFLRENKDLWV